MGTYRRQGPGVTRVSLLSTASQVPCMRPRCGALYIVRDAFSRESVLVMTEWALMSLCRRGLSCLVDGIKETACPGRAVAASSLMVK